MSNHGITEEILAKLRDPSVPIDARLLDSLSKEITDELDVSQRLHLLNYLSTLLPSLQQDPSSATSLIKRLIDVPNFSFQRVLEIEPKVDFHAGLAVQSIPINLVTIDLLEKAQYDRGDIGILAGMPSVVYLLVQKMLSEDIALHLKAMNLLVELLTGPHSSQLVWRRILDDVQIYEFFFWSCSLKNQADKYQQVDGKQFSAKTKTICQSRLLAFLAKIDSTQIRISHHRDIETTYAAQNLLEFAVNRMVDFRLDVMMHLNLMQFFSDWLRESKSRRPGLNDVETVPSLPDSSPALYYLQASGLHARTASYYHSPTGPNSFDSRILYSQASRYLETYYLLHSRHAMTKLHHLLHRTLTRITMVLQETSPSDFALRPPPDLKLLTALPRAALLLQQQHQANSTPVYLQLPCETKSAAVFETLASLFNGGPIKSRECAVEEQEVASNSPAASRALYYLYLKSNPSFWGYVIQAAETLALKEAAIAANHLIFSVIDAQWDTIEEATFSSSGGNEPEYYIRSEQQLSDLCEGPLPPSAPLAILSSPALETVVPYLLKPAHTSTNLGIGGKADLEKTVNNIAAIRFDALSVLHRKLKQHAHMHGAEWWDIVTQMEKRLAQGRWGDMSGIGGRIATMEH